MERTGLFVKKIGKGAIKILGILTALLILSTVGILLYPKYAKELGLEDKVEELFSETETTTEEATTTEISTEEWQPPEEESTEDNSDKLSRQQQDAIHEAYTNILDTMGYDAQAVLFYDIKEIEGNDFYAFQITDGEGDTFEYLLLSDVDTGTLYWCDSNDDLGYARATDVLYTADREGKEEVSYDDDAWKPVFTAFMKAMLENKDAQEADSYVDTSYFYAARMSEKDRKHYVDDTADFQEQLIEKVNALEEQKKEGKILSYKTSYKIVESEEMEDETGAPWMDVYVHVVLSSEDKNEIEEEDLYYMASLRRYSYGWRVATFNDDY